MQNIPSWLVKKLSTEDLNSIEQAIILAEKSTSAEIVPMIVRSSTPTGHIFKLLFSFVFVAHLFCSFYYLDLSSIGPLIFILVSLGLSYLVCLKLSELGVIVRALSVGRDVNNQVFMRAENEFYKAGLNNTSGATGVLIYVSLLEHQVVVLADKSIADKVPSSTWQELVNIFTTDIKSANLSKGFIDAIERCSKVVSAPFPREHNDVDELKNHLVIKE